MKRKEQMRQYYFKNRARLLPKQKIYYQKNREKILERTKKYRNSTKGKKAKNDWKKKQTVGKRSAGHLKRRTNIIVNYKDLDVLYLKQKGKCAICGKKLPKKGTNCCLDHNHKTKKIRGWLCGKCNKGLGHFNDSINLLKKATKYLERYK